MFITSFGEQNITYKCCSNFLIHLCHENEYILWLAGFIEKITEGGPKTPPPIKNFIPEFISLRLEFDSVALPYEKNENQGEEITEYFNSQAFTKTLKK